MSDPQFSHEMWLSKLKDHLKEERYAAGSARRCIAEARFFMAYLGKRRVEVSAAQPEDVEPCCTWSTSREICWIRWATA
jgi:hypothetical protein